MITCYENVKVHKEVNREDNRKEKDEG